MLRLEGVSKYYGPTAAVEDVSLTVEDGDFLTLLGPSGSGKTTILGIVAGYLAADRGTIVLDGRDVRRMSAADRGIGVVFQHYALFPHMTVAENIAYGLRRRRWPRARVRERVTEMMALIGLQGLEERRPSQLSGGQQQRVALARALAFEPALLLMDEPLGALDREIRGQMQSEIRRIHRETQTTVVYVTHDKEEAYALSTRIGIMRNARLVALAAPETLYREPESAFVASFFGGHQVLRCEVLDAGAGPAARLRVGGQETQVALDGAVADGPMCLAFPPEAVTVGGASSPGDLGFGGVVEDVVYMGSTLHIHCAIEGSGERLSLNLPPERRDEIAIGDRVQLRVEATDVRVVTPE